MAVKNNCILYNVPNEQVEANPVAADVEDAASEQEQSKSEYGSNDDNENTSSEDGSDDTSTSIITLDTVLIKITLLSVLYQPRKTNLPKCHVKQKADR